jgi:hypothetical protein
MKRNKVEIKVWLERAGFRQVDIQNDLQMNSNVQISETLRGTRSDRRVLQWLIDKGCPKKFLALPDDMKEAA